ncbi:capsular polysaccharide biosynthesis protein [Neisseria animalis]|uniref:Capsular polysaccharide biosynthesis protein n=1 Tax=Neisseria animalis TaxID=492 RepID=A0A5P3MR45_NEIAN|nr:capsular polysaccharide biosynthesis protein [Neisseria animalis]QEY23261.1 capsular polysaccharide biosynthesis protein [Neisseria animalis]ROW31984.1 capsular polysaccharide biosynthesis protein [Neisseria animalis]VEE08537.1 capsule polysaccharide modification protein [Neisseria animalis]
MKTAYIPSSGIRKIPNLNRFLPEFAISKSPVGAEAVIGWGLRPTTRKARAFAAKHYLPFIALEDGFVRSLGLGVEGWPPFAMILDDIGIYYDTTRPSRLEQLILAAEMPSALLAEAQAAADFIVNQRLSKYNHAPDFETVFPEWCEKPSAKNVVLVIDQTFGDMALQYGGADEQTFVQMFQAALTENPDAEIWVKTHPDVLCGKKRGYLTDLVQQPRVRLLAADVNPISLLQQADKVYAVTSQMGFEALLCGKPLVTFGLPWYAGWGVSDDRHPGAANLARQNRRAPRSLMQLFAAAYLQYSRYLNPNTGEAGTLSDVLNYLATMRRQNEKLRGEIYCVGMSLWKRAVIKPFFHFPSCRLKFVGSVKKLKHTEFPADARLLAWGNGRQEIADFAARQNIPLLRMEDGFIRSVGLGSNLVPALSLVIDDMGIYFNAETPSRLEHILQHQAFGEHDLQTALSLQTVLTESNISKYNVGSRSFSVPDTGKTVILVPGQVEDDASIRYGSPQIFRNLDLLKAVRARNPDAYIVYKPHPDVVSGNRTGSIPPEETARYADQTAAEADILACLQYADEVHTMTSLTGFEALLRGKKVCCYGLPFYAGWGLTEDLLPIPRRSRRLRLPELVAGTLLHYPQYTHPDTLQATNALTAALALAQQKSRQKSSHGIYRSWPAKQVDKIRHLIRLLKRR